MYRRNVQAFHLGVYVNSDKIGGAERSTFTAIAGADDALTFTIVTRSKAVIDAARVHAPRAHTHLLASPARGKIRELRELRSTFRALGIDLLHVSLNNPFQSPTPVIAARTLRLPVVAVEHLVTPARRTRGALLKRLLSKLLSAHVAVGQSSALDLQQFFGINSGAITVIYNGVDLSPVQPVSGVRTEQYVLLGCAARFEEQKGLDLLIDALAELPQSSLLLVGDGSLRGELMARVAASGLSDRVHCTGWVDDARPYIAAMDVFVLPSHNEAFPLTVLEAMVQRVPVVASDVGSVAEAVLNGQTGLLVPPGDRAALVAAIRRIVTEEALRNRIVVAAAARTAENFSSATMVDAYTGVWTAALRNAATTRRLAGRNIGRQDTVSGREPAM